MQTVRSEGEFRMRELSKVSLEKWLVVCWCLLFLGAWVDFCLHVFHNWHAMSSEPRTDSCLFLFFALALFAQLVKNRSPWLTIMTAAMLFGSASYLVIHL
jgi:hypothetical protein